MSCLRDKLIEIEERICFLEYLARTNEGPEKTKLLKDLDKTKKKRAGIREDYLEAQLQGVE
jgi:hypothetical protein